MPSLWFFFFVWMLICFYCQNLLCIKTQDMQILCHVCAHQNKPWSNVSISETYSLVMCAILQLCIMEENFHTSCNLGILGNLMKNHTLYAALNVNISNIAIHWIASNVSMGMIESKAQEVVSWTSQCQNIKKSRILIEL